MSDVRKKLESEIMQVEWKELRRHLEKDVVITVTEDLALIDVAEAVANDEKAKVAKWVNGGKISKPTEEQLRSWEQQLDLPFRFVIVYPYVLIQKVAH